MNEQAEDTELYSTLEVVDRHSIVGGLERDHAINAPEVNDAAYTRQAAFDQKTAIVDLAPKSNNKSDDGLQAVDEPERNHKGHKSHVLGLSRKAEISLLVLLIVVVLAAAGIGIGVGVTNKKSSDRAGQTNANSTSNSGSQPSVVSASKHLILNDSSLAALTLMGAERTIVFQDQEGVVRQANYKTSAGNWSMASSPVIASGPKNHTPLALLHNPNTTDETIHLFYIATSNNLAFVVYDTFNRSWSNHTELVDSKGSPFRAATKSRTLLAKRFGISTPSSLQVIIHYENADGNLTVLEGVNTPPSPAWALQDITSNLTSSLRSQGILRVPCSSIRNGNNLRLISTEQTGANLSVNYTVVTADYGDERLDSTSEKNIFDPTAIGQSDIQLAFNADQLYGFWVNGTSLAFFQTDRSSPAIQIMPDSSFPYVRLAGIPPNPGSVYYLYNQISPDTFMENQWHYNTGNWTPSKINITDI